MTAVQTSAENIAIDVHGLSKSFGGREVVHDAVTAAMDDAMYAMNEEITEKVLLSLSTR